MSGLGRVLAQLAVDLGALNVEWALIGGVAISVRARPRTTLDLDLAISVASDREAEALVRSLISGGYQHDAFHLEHEQGRGRLAMVRLSGEAHVPIDLLFASSGIEKEVVDNAERLEALPDVAVPVASIEDLIALKVLSGRLQDRADVASLLAVASPQQRQRARQRMRLIQERGYARGKNLARELDDIESISGDSARH